jgi:hypothetical protein
MDRNQCVGDLANHHREEGRGQEAARNRVEIGHRRNLAPQQKFRALL